jgi:hypothetical protein
MKQEQTTGAVIVEVRGRKAAALTQGGEFIRVNNEGYTIGQQVLLAPQPEAIRPVQRARMTAFAAMAAGFLLLVFGGFKGYTLPVGVVSLDVNPSIEYTINAFDRVLDITAVNDDGSLILADMDKQALLYHPVDEAVDATILALRQNGYLTGSANDIVISSSSYDTKHTESIADRLGTHVGEQDDLSVLSVPVSRSEVEDAHARGTSAGKLYIVEELEDSWTSSESFDADDWIARPVREIIHETEYQRDGKDGENGGTDSAYGSSDMTSSGGDSAKTEQSGQNGTQEPTQKPEEGQQPDGNKEGTHEP